MTDIDYCNDEHGRKLYAYMYMPYILLVNYKLQINNFLIKYFSYPSEQWW